MAAEVEGRESAVADGEFFRGCGVGGKKGVSRWMGRSYGVMWGFDGQRSLLTWMERRL